MSRAFKLLEARAVFAGRTSFSQSFHSQSYYSMLQRRTVARSVFQRNVATEDVPLSSSKLGSAKPTSDQNVQGTASERRTGQTTGGGMQNGDHDLPAELFGGKTRQVDNRKPLSEQIGGGDHRTSEGFSAASSHHKDRQQGQQVQTPTLGDKAAAAKDFVADAAGAAKDFVKTKAGAAAATVKEAAGAAKGFVSNTENAQANSTGTSSYSSSKSGAEEIQQQGNLEKRTSQKTPPAEAHDANERLKHMEQAGIGKSTATGSPYTDPKNKRAS